MCELVGLKVVGLKRIRIGRVTLGNLPVGQWRYLGPHERFCDFFAAAQGAAPGALLA